MTVVFKDEWIREIADERRTREEGPIQSVRRQKLDLVAVGFSLSELAILQALSS